MAHTAGHSGGEENVIEALTHRATIPVAGEKDLPPALWAYSSFTDRELTILTVNSESRTSLLLHQPTVSASPN